MPEPPRPAASEARPVQTAAIPAPPHSPVVATPASQMPPAAKPASARPAAEAMRPASAPVMPTAPSAPKPAAAAFASTTAASVSAPATQHTAASITQPLNRFQTTSKNENPFLPKSTLDKIRENHQNDASAELRKLIQTNPLNKLSFDATPGSKEYQALRQKASQLVNEVIRANMPRMEAELRMKLEQEVDRMFKDIRKK
ncbi:MAG TPA: hypothetical protein VM553_09650 [Dongiaceae bacterium]|nr:hypothetical protein [Dongiaceae bacterium]